MAFIPEAVRRGARAVVSSMETPRTARRVVIIPVADNRYAAAMLARAWYADASRDVATIGITDTNGNTTVAYLIQLLLQQAGRPCGLVGTIEYRMGDRRESL